ncbi:MAG: phage tail sheath C-terminal domain-containing protein [Lentimicrobium sp.]|jgi:phage tail sheath protein FI|nr:phage tail sheath C-terminal domain-containing protein [Lentimicrobium sp.]
MATPYTTPGVYVKEIPSLLSSIAPVETAIPAFIGYTEMAIRNGESLLNKPTRIESIAEYELLFGGPPSQNVEIFLNGDNNFVSSQAESILYLYDSLRMFYANGGGKCFIVSVGKYPSSRSGIQATTIEAGLPELEKEDEPTIILMPEAVSVSGGPYGLQQEALAQSAKLMNRITVCDLVKATDAIDFNTKVAEFRNGIGMNNLKYGAAYGPWINANLPRSLRRKNLILKRDGTNSPIQLESLTTDAGILKLLSDVKLAEVAGAAMVTSESTISGAPEKTLGDALQAALDAYRLTDSTTSAADLTTALQAFTNLTFAILKAVQDINATAYPVDTMFKIKTDIANYLANPALKDSIKRLAAHHLLIDASPSVIKVIDTGNANWNPSAVLFGYADGAALLTDAGTIDVSADYAGVTTNKGRADIARDAAYIASGNAMAIFRHVEKSIDEFEKSLNNTLQVAFGKFKELTTKGAEALNLLPPSGAIAGVYAKTDNERGVWKAPANISLNAVISPAVKISHEQQAEYNVDVNAGKSINIIRAFTGKGTLVWGARTLAGNDNEWRYVNVRRFFNFVEESVKKATEQFVFEPNDANTWVKVQGMIENFLTTLWRQGALQGVKPEHAFYVAVGLGKTMTALDILEGRLIVEIGMAAVRPAEFIILRFSHKMVKS